MVTEPVPVAAITKRRVVSCAKADKPTPPLVEPTERATIWMSPFCVRKVLPTPVVLRHACKSMPIGYCVLTLAEPNKRRSPSTPASMFTP